MFTVTHLPDGTVEHVAKCDGVTYIVPGGTGALHRICKTGACHEPKLTSKVKGLCRAVKGWIKGGARRRSPQQVAEILETCKLCEYFKDGGCIKCGCSLNYKIMMASEHCPVEKW